MDIPNTWVSFHPLSNDNLFTYLYEYLVYHSDALKDEVP